MNITNKTNTSFATARNLGKSLLLSAAFALATASGLQADDYTWVGGTDFIWDTTTTNWTVGTANWSGTANSAWVNGNNKAFFPSVGGTITFADATLKHGDIGLEYGTWTFENTTNADLNSGEYSFVQYHSGTVYLEGIYNFGALRRLTNSTVYFSDVRVLGVPTSAGGGNPIALNEGSSRLVFTGETGTIERTVMADSTGGNGIEVTHGTLTLDKWGGPTQNDTRILNKWGNGTLVMHGLGAGNRGLTVHAGTVELEAPVTDDNPTVNWAFTINAGTVRITGGSPSDGSIAAKGNQLSSTRNIIVNGSGSSTPGTLDLNGYNERVGGVTGNANGIITNGNSGKGSNLFVGGLNTDTTFAGKVTGNLGLTKEGTGTLELSNIPDYTGTTTANGGILKLTNTGIITLPGGVTGTGTIQKPNGADLTFSGVVAPGVVTFDTDGVTPLSATGTLNFAGNVVLSDVTRLIVGVDSAGLITNAISGASGGTLTFATGGELYVVFEGGSAAGITIAASEFATAFGLTEGQLGSVTIKSNDGVLIYDGENQYVAIPEPSTYALFGAIGAVGLALLRRRRRQTV